MKLVSPSEIYEASYCDYLAELGEAVRVPYPLTYSHEPFSELVQKLLDQSRGIGVAEGFVPNSSFWLVEGLRIVGVSNLRHSLTPALEVVGGHIGFGVRPSVRQNGVGTELLRQTIDEAFRLGLRRLLLTCDKENVGSAGVIVANQGVLENEVVDAETGRITQRYWIGGCCREGIY